MNDQILHALLEQNKLLQQLVNNTSTKELGLHNNVGGVQRIYCNRSNNCNWYKVSKDSEVIPVTETALTGYLRELKFEEVERRGKPVWKTLITVEADKTYILESGVSSHFSKSFVAAIATLTPDQLQAPVTISPKEGTEDDQVLFARVWVGDEYIKSEYKDADVKQLAARARDVVKFANGAHQQEIIPPSAPAEPVIQSVAQQYPKAAAPQPETTTDLISQAQVNRLWVIASKHQVEEEQVREILGTIGLSSTKDIRKDQYEEIVEAVKQAKPRLLNTDTLDSF